MMFASGVDEITHACDSCGVETKVEVKVELGRAIPHLT
jgi:hypothetical protein